ncbi:MAG: hypothetical protein J5832_03860, partial [Clostridia bacterium]|nr:hypothetical protein [Clostridia bacterium]
KYFTTQYRYTYYYCEGQYYALDDGGYYKLINGEKWYYVSCDNDIVKMQPTMMTNGNIAYSLVRFCPIADENGQALPNTNKIILRNGNTEKKQVVKWIKNKSYGYVEGADYKFIQDSGITYISQRGFKFSGDEYTQALNEYLEAGRQSRGSKVIIFDFRSNSGGGSDDLYESFVKGITDADIEFRQFHAIRWNALAKQYSTPLGEERFDVVRNDSGHVTKNDIPIIILVDEACGSGGDEIFCVTRTLENVIVIGSNNGGYYINDVQQYNLPNSGIAFDMGGRFWLHYSMENLDGIGSKPDIWCNPVDALNIALELIVNEGLTTREDVDSISDKLPLKQSDDIEISIGNYTFSKNYGTIGAGIGNKGDVMYKGEKVTDFRVVMLDGEKYGLVLNKNGKIVLESKKTGKVKFRLYYGNEVKDFTWNVKK